jgi:hypothetical protein
MRTNSTLATALESIVLELRAKEEPAEAPRERQRKMGLDIVQKRLEAARNEVARLEQEQDRMQAEGHGVLCQCYWCRQGHGNRELDPCMTGRGMKLEDGRPA